MDNKEGEKKKIDPGWNDPPMLNYTPTNPPPKSRITNKRVAFPINSGSSSSSAAPTSPMPPLPKSSNLPPSIQTLVTQKFPEDLLKNMKDNSEHLFSRTKDNFGKFILTLKDQKTKDCIHLMYKLWEEGKFSDDCQKSIYLMSLCLAENEPTSAMAIKYKLLIGYKESCEDWLNNFVI